MSLSKTERLILANQYRILALLEPDQAESHDTIREALENGYVAAYERVFDWIDDDLTEEDCRLVVDSLTVYEALHRSAQKMADKTGIDERLLSYPGFDGNNEAQHLGYLRHVVRKEGRFDYLKFDSKDLNSHMPMIPIYERMISKHAEFGEHLDLSPGEARAIFDAMRHRG